jgi:excisionase family DNA binding protein
MQPTQTENAREPFSRLFTTTQASTLLGVSARLLRRMIKNGSLRATRFGGRGYHRIPLSEIERLGSLAKESQK